MENGPVQLVVFEKGTGRHMWRYLTTYKAGNELERERSESTIRTLFDALHGRDEVRWLVIAREGEDLAHFWNLTREGRSGMRRPVTVNAPERLGAVVLELPGTIEIVDTPRCGICGAMLPAIGKCTVCHSQSAQKETDHARSYS